MKIARFVLTGLLLAVSAAGAEDLTITGQTMELLDQGKKTLFSGRVVLTRGSHKILSDRMVSEGDHDVVEATGHVRFSGVTTDGHRISGRGEKARYVKASGQSTVWGKPAWAERTDPKDPQASLTAEAEKMIHAQDTLELEKGDVQPKVNTRSPEGSGEYQADHITVDTARRIMIARDNVTGWFVLPPESRP